MTREWGENLKTNCYFLFTKQTVASDLLNSQEILEGKIISTFRQYSGRAFARGENKQNWKIFQRKPGMILHGIFECF